MKTLMKTVIHFFQALQHEQKKNSYTPCYQVVDILKEEEYRVVIKLKNKNVIFTVKPEEILANETLIDQFSPKDIRTLTYLGYLGIHSPKYKVMAKKLSPNEKVTFTLKEKGQKQIFTRTADQITTSNLIPQMDAVDANVVGYVFASEMFEEEKRQKRILKNKN